MKKKLRIIYPATIRFSHLYQRPQQMLNAFARIGIEAIFIDAGDTNLITKDGLKVVPFGTKIHKDERFLDVLWVSYPPNIKEYMKIPHDILVFDAIDEPNGKFMHWENGWEYACINADFVFATAETLSKRALSFKDQVFFVPNGCEFNHFNTYGYKNHRLNPTLGFCGALASWLDWELLKEIAIRFKHLKLKFIGPVYDKCNIFSAPNVEYTGHIDYHDLPKAFEDIDILLVPFDIKDPVTKSVNPVKIYEYLATGKHIISTDMPEVNKINYNNAIYIAKDHEDFFKGISEMLKKGKCNDLISARKAIAKKHSWDNIAKEVEMILNGEYSKSKECVCQVRTA